MPEQSRDELETELLADLEKTLAHFLDSLADYLADAYDEEQALTAAAAFDPKHLQAADVLWSAALRATLPPGTYDTLRVAIPPGVQNAIRDAAMSWGTWAKDSTRAKIRQQLKQKILPPSRSFVESLARSEATQRWNHRYLTNAKRAVNLQRLTGNAEPTYKRWVAINDDRTRHDHSAADGQTVLLTDSFTVGGYAMQYPGDTRAPASQTRNCRCVMEIFQAEEAESMKLLLASGAEGAPWSGTLVFENEVTGDGRFIEPGALYWDEGGAPLRFVLADTGAHDGAVVVGRITGMVREGGSINAKGYIDTGSAYGVEARRLLAGNLLNGVSVDLDDVSFEIRVKASDDDTSSEPILASAGQQLDLDDLEVVYEGSPHDEVMVIKSARIRAATLVSIPAFANARIDLDDEMEVIDITDEERANAAASETLPSVVIASAAAPSKTDWAPPAEWFDNPGLTAETPIHVTDDGRVYGHIATWRTEHIARPGTTPPRSQSDYRYFHTGALLTAEGKQLAIGRLTVGTGHADDDAAPMKAMNHYDHTGTAVAYVRAGEDAYGIWVAGAVRPEATPEQIRELRASPPSGDWRRIGGALELVAVLHVNTAGFPVPRGLVASGHMQTFIAYGPRPTEGGILIPALTVEQAEALGQMADEYRRKRDKQMADTLARARSLKRSMALARARDLAERMK